MSGVILGKPRCPISSSSSKPPDSSVPGIILPSRVVPPPRGLWQLPQPPMVATRYWPRSTIVSALADVQAVTNHGEVDDWREAQLRGAMLLHRIYLVAADVRGALGTAVKSRI